jgi:hypothetical protein
VGTLVATDRPIVPDSPVAPGGTKAAGETYYQSRLTLENGGDKPIWLDPGNFTLRDGDQVLYLDPARSGPPPRTLLPGASLDVTLTFPGPADLRPELLFQPAWFPAGLTVKGKPTGGESENTAG